MTPKTEIPNSKNEKSDFKPDAKTVSENESKISGLPPKYEVNWKIEPYNVMI